MQNPTIGRIVHYYPRTMDLVQAPGPLAAIITSVSEDVVALRVFTPNGDFVRTQVSEAYVPDEPIPGHWSWPPRV